MIILIIAAIGATPGPKKIAAIVKKNRHTDRIFNIVEPLALMALLAICIAFLIDGSFNPFLYFRF